MKIDIRKLLIGSDFELFVKNTQGECVSAIPFIEGTKSEPLAITEKGHAIQHDGVLAEGNVPPVDINSREEMWKNLQFVMEAMQDKLPAELKLECCANGTFDSKELVEPEARVGGCDPDYNAWEDGSQNEKPNLEETGDRCAAMHLHFSFPGATVKLGMRLIRILDMNLALPLLFVDTDRKRRLLYGKMGAFRFKDFGSVAGVEYRVLSNVVLKNKEIFDFVWRQIEKSIIDFNNGKDYLHYKERLEESINKYDLDQAEQLCDELKVSRLMEEEVFVQV